jgi:hypothetical protein
VVGRLLLNLGLKRPGGMSCGDFAGRDVFGTGDEVSLSGGGMPCPWSLVDPLRLGSFDPWRSAGRRFLAPPPHRQTSSQ